MEETVSVGIILVILGLPFLMGWKIKSTRRGIAGTSAIPLLLIGWGLFGVFEARSSDAHDADDWAMMVLIVAVLSAITLEIVGLVFFGLGRIIRKCCPAGKHSVEPQRPVLSPAVDAPQREVSW
jgi:hypothetical protein